MMRGRQVGWVASLLVAAGCTVFAQKGDYAEYREIRLAESERERNRAMADYVRKHPDGQWAAEMRAKRQRSETDVYEQSKSTRRGLKYYLDLYPEGEYAPQARSRLEALGKVAESKETEEEAREEVRREQREEAAEARRRWATRAVGFWVKTLVGIDNWGSAIPQVAKNNPEFNRAFGKKPRPRCSKKECVKFYELPFRIPVPGSSAIRREVHLMLRLKLDKGKLVRAEVLLPNKGFSRWYELQNQEVVNDANPTKRQKAISWVMDRIEPVLEKAAPNAEPFDLIPEAIKPPEVRAPNQPDPGAANLPGQKQEQQGSAEQEEQGEQEQEPDQGGGQQGDGDLDTLLDEAVGDQAGSDKDQQKKQQDEQEPAAEMKLPIAIQGYRAGPIRIGIFAASPDDQGKAYDGVFLELDPEQQDEGDGESEGESSEGESSEGESSQAEDSGASADDGKPEPSSEDEESSAGDNAKSSNQGQQAGADD